MDVMYRASVAQESELECFLMRYFTLSQIVLIVTGYGRQQRDAETWEHVFVASGQESLDKCGGGDTVHPTILLARTLMALQPARIRWSRRVAIAPRIIFVMTTTPSDSTSIGGIVAKLKALADLKSSGALTQQEYEVAKAKALAEESDSFVEPSSTSNVDVIDVIASDQDCSRSHQLEVDELVGSIVRQEMLNLASQDPEEQEANLPTMLKRVEDRAIKASKKSGYQFGDITKTVVETTRGEVQRQLAADWTMDDVGLLLKVALFLSAGAAAPVAGFAALPAAALISTYGAILKLELGGRAVQEVGTRFAERAKDDVAQSVRGYTGKDEYKFGDLTEATVRKVTGSKAYKFGDLTRNAVKSVTGKDEYKFGDISKSLFGKLTGKDDNQRENK